MRGTMNAKSSGLKLAGQGNGSCFIYSYVRCMPETFVLARYQLIGMRLDIFDHATNGIAALYRRNAGFGLFRKHSYYVTSAEPST